MATMLYVCVPYCKESRIARFPSMNHSISEFVSFDLRLLSLDYHAQSTLQVLFAEKLSFLGGEFGDEFFVFLGQLLHFVFDLGVGHESALLGQSQTSLLASFDLILVTQNLFLLIGESADERGGGEKKGELKKKRKKKRAGEDKK